MAEHSGKQPKSAAEAQLTHVTLTFDRELSDQEVKQMQLQHNAIRVLKGGGGHHDHDHPKLV